jgi:Cdc6-like AAA superfamily ATPase
MADTRISDNHVSNSPNTHITHTNNVHSYAPPSTEPLRKWMLDRATSSKYMHLPSILAPRHADAILLSAAFKACISQKAAVMVLKGRMGAGKTTVISRLFQTLRESRDTVVVFLSFDAQISTQQDLSRVLMHFVRQIVDLHDKAHYNVLSGLQGRFPDERPSEHEVADTFVTLATEVIKKPGRALCILLDGVDHCKDRDCLDSLLRHVASIQERIRCGVVITSRLDELCVKQVFRVETRTSISATYEDIQDIVTRYSASHYVSELIYKDQSQISTISRAISEGSKDL